MNGSKVGGKYTGDNYGAWNAPYSRRGRRLVDESSQLHAKRESDSNEGGQY